MIWLAAIPVFWALMILHFFWGRRRRATAGPPPPRPPSSSCTWCQVRPQGLCTCTSVCGHKRCIGDHTSLATLTAADMRLLDKWIREGRE